MPILRFKHGEAEQHRQVSETLQVTEQKVLTGLKAASGVNPPPGIELLGVWSKIELFVISRTGMLPFSVAFDYVVFESLSQDGYFEGYVSSQGKYLMNGDKFKAIPWRANKKYFELKGKVLRPGYARAVLIPTSAMTIDGAIISPHVSELTWKGTELRGYDKNRMTGVIDSYIAVKVGDLNGRHD